MAETNSYPIVIVPGVMGSRLFISATDFSTDSVAWDPAVSPKGITEINERLAPQNTVYVRPCELQNQSPDFYDSESTIPKYGQEYGALAQYREIVKRLSEEFSNDNFRPVYFFSFDWRKRNEETALLLRDEIDKILNRHNADKLDLVCHSMGGLVGTSYFSEFGNEGKINKFISVGTPFEGAPKLLNSILNWDILGTGANPFTKTTWTDIALGLLGGMQTKLKASFDGVAELCPTKEYLKKTPMRKEVISFPRKTFSELSLDDYDKMCVQIFGEERFKNSRDFQQSLKDPETGYNKILFYEKSYYSFGTGRNTIQAVRFDHRRVDVDHLFYENDTGEVNTGDGTVPYLSASMMGAITTLPENRWHTFNSHHNGLVQNKDALDWIVQVLKN